MEIALIDIALSVFILVGAGFLGVVAMALYKEIKKDDKNGK